MKTAYQALAELAVAARPVIELGDADTLDIDYEALDRVAADNASDLRLFLSESQPTSLLAWGAEWARCGLPQVVVGNRLAASLMATSMERAATDDLRVPWTAFSIVLPPGLVEAPHPLTGRSTPWSRVHVLQFRSGTLAIYATAADLALWTTAPRHVSEFADPEEMDSPGWGETAMGLDAADKRAFAVVDRLVLGVCAELSSPHAARAVALQTDQARRAPTDRSGPPRVWTYTLRRDVRVDCRAAVLSYVRGDARRVTVQSFVRGHWKRQRYGVGREHVKWIAIEPYWRGPETAPIAVRSHRLTEAA